MQLQGEDSETGHESGRTDHQPSFLDRERVWFGGDISCDNL